MKADIMHSLSGHSRDVRHVATGFAEKAHVILLEY